MGIGLADILQHSYVIATKGTASSHYHLNKARVGPRISVKVAMRTIR